MTAAPEQLAGDHVGEVVDAEQDPVGADEEGDRDRGDDDHQRRSSRRRTSISASTIATPAADAMRRGVPGGEARRLEDRDRVVRTPGRLRSITGLRAVTASVVVVITPTVQIAARRWLAREQQHGRDHRGRGHRPELEAVLHGEEELP